MSRANLDPSHFPKYSLDFPRLAGRHLKFDVISTHFFRCALMRECSFFQAFNLLGYSAENGARFFYFFARCFFALRPNKLSVWKRLKRMEFRKPVVGTRLILRLIGFQVANITFRVDEISASGRLSAVLTIGVISPVSVATATEISTSLRS